MKKVLFVGSVALVLVGAILAVWWQQNNVVTKSATQVTNSVEPVSKFNQFEIGNKNVKSIYVDGTDVWVGTSAGAVKYDTLDDSYKLYSVRNALLANGVFHITKIDGRIAVGTYGGGLSMYDETKDDWQIYNIPEGLGDAFVYGTLQMRNGDVWIATWTGANLITQGKLDDPDAWQVFTVANTEGGLPNDWVYGLAEGKNGEVWMATEGGLGRYYQGKWTNWRHADGLGATWEMVKDQNTLLVDPADYSEHHARQKVEMGLSETTGAFNPNYIVALTVDAEGVVWVGTWGGGLSRYDGETWQTVTMADGLPSNHIFSLYIDSKQQMWIGTSHGLARENPEGGYDTFTREHGLVSDTVFSMTEESDGTYWVGSYGGVSRIQGF